MRLARKVVANRSAAQRVRTPRNKELQLPGPAVQSVVWRLVLSAASESGPAAELQSSLGRLKMSIRDMLLPALLARFADRKPRAGASTDELVIFPAAHPGFGDLVVLDDGHEATIVLGTLMHTHIDGHPRRVPADVDREVTEAVLEFLDDLFADRIVVWSVLRRAGGYYYVGGKATHVPEEARVFVWSGPLAR